MLVKNKKSNTVLMVVVGFAVILLVSVVIAVVIISSRQANLPDNLSADNNNQINTSDNDSSNQSSDKKQNGTNTDDNTMAVNDLKGEIVSNRIIASVLQLRANIDSQISSGSCSLTMTGPNGQKYTDQTDIIINSDNKTSTCNGFDITLSNLDKDDEKLHGKWAVNIRLKTKGHTGDINGEITI